MSLQGLSLLLTEVVLLIIEMAGIILAGQLGMLAALLKRGCQVNAPTNDGWTALHEAAANGHALIVDKLLASAAQVSHPLCLPLHGLPLVNAMLAFLPLYLLCASIHLLDCVHPHICLT